MFSAFNPSKCTHLEQWAADCAAPGEQSWTSCRSRDSNPQPWVTSGFKSNALSIRPTTAEHLWGILKRQVEHHSPSSIQSLKEVILEEWKKIDLAKCRQLVHSMPRRLGAVIKNHGGHTSTRFST